MDPRPVSLFTGMGPPPRSPPDEQELRYRAQFATLYARYVRFVERRVRATGLRAADVADVVQEVFEVLNRELRRGLDTRADLYGWLDTTTFRKACDFMQLARNREQPAHEGAGELSAKGPNPEEHSMMAELRKTVQAVLDELPDEQRRVLEMTDLLEMPMSRIAEILAIPEGTGYSRLRAARRAFQERWEQRATSFAAIAPLPLWDTTSLLKAHIPETPLGFEDEVWSRLVDSLGWGGAAAGAAGGVLGASAAKAGVASAAKAGAASAAKAGVLLTAKQVAAVIVASAVAGAGIYAATHKAVDEPRPKAVIAAHDEGRALGQGAAPVEPLALAPSVAPSVATTAAPSVASIVAATPSSSVVASDRGSEASDRIQLDIARTKLDQGDITGARDALKLVKTRRFKGERDELLRTVLTYQDGGRQ